MARAPVDRRYRLAVAGRLVAALPGGYLIACLLSLALAWAWPGEPIEAATWGTLAALVAWPAVAMACLAARSTARAWAGVAIAAGLLAGVAMLGGWRG